MRADDLERARPCPVFREVVRVSQDAGPPKKATILHWSSVEAAIVYEESTTPVKVAHSKVLRYPLAAANLRSRVPEIAEHVAAPYGAPQVFHELSHLRGILKRQRAD